MSKPTIADVARNAGVSKVTAGRVLAGSPLHDAEVQARVEQAIACLDERPDPLPAGAGSLIALCHDGTNPQFALAVQQGILGAITGSEFALAVPALTGDPAEALREFIRQHTPAGVLLLSPLSEDAVLTDLCREELCDYVRIGASPLDHVDHLIASNDREAAAQAVGYLVSLGHRRIGIVAGPENSLTAQERELGYLDAMADHDLDRGPALIAGGDFSFESGLAAGRLLLEVSPRPTAIFACGDAMAAGVLHAAREKNIAVPADLSIMGFEDVSPAAEVWPPLTTMRLPLRKMASAAALKAAYPEAAGQAPTHFRARLIERGSTGQAKEG